jgi:hypothetical protein
MGAWRSGNGPAGDHDPVAARWLSDILMPEFRTSFPAAGVAVRRQMRFRDAFRKMTERIKTGQTETR